MVKEIGNEEEWADLMEQSMEKLVVVDFTASWWVLLIVADRNILRPRADMGGDGRVWSWSWRDMHVGTV